MKTKKKETDGYKAWLEYFKKRGDMSEREKNVFLDTMVLMNSPVFTYTPPK